MSRVEVGSYLRRGDDDFVPLAEVPRFTGDCNYMPGAVVLDVDGTELLSLDLWDDINWLWPFLIQAVEECRTSGVGERSFPDQPILFRARSLGDSGYLTLTVKSRSVDRAVTVRSDELFTAMAAAGLEFIAEYGRLCGSGPGYDTEAAVLRSWQGL